MYVEISPWWRKQQMMSIAALLTIFAHFGWLFVVDILPGLNIELPESDQFVPSTDFYIDRGEPFPIYARQVRDHLLRHRLPVESRRFSHQVQLKWVEPHSQGISGECRETNGRALLIHDLYGSAYQMNDIADSLSRACFESDVMLLPGHGTRVADVGLVGADDYLQAVKTRIDVFRGSCSNCLMFGYGFGGLLAALALMEDSRKIHGLVLLAPWWDSGLSDRMGILNLFLGSDDYSPFSLRQFLPTHYGYEHQNGYIQAESLQEKLAYANFQEGASRLNLPGLIVLAEKDEVLDVGGVGELTPVVFSAMPQVLLYTDPDGAFGAQYREAVRAQGGRIEILQASWPDFGIDELSHFGMVFSPDNYLYGFNGVYGPCMDAGFDCKDRPIDVRYVARSSNPKPDEAMTASHPEFSRMMVHVIQFIRSTMIFDR